MKDRIVQYPSRYKLTQISGDIYDLTPVPGNVTEQGTDLNKANLFPDDVAVALGLDPADNPQIKDGFMSLASRPMDELVLPPEFGLLYSGTSMADLTGATFAIAARLVGCSNAVTVEIYAKLSDNDASFALRTAFGADSYARGPTLSYSTGGATTRLTLLDVPGGILVCSDFFDTTIPTLNTRYIPGKRIENIKAIGFSFTKTVEAGATIKIYGRRL